VIRSRSAISTPSCSRLCFLRYYFSPFIFLLAGGSVVALARQPGKQFRTHSPAGRHRRSARASAPDVRLFVLSAVVFAPATAACAQPLREAMGLRASMPKPDLTAGVLALSYGAMLILQDASVLRQPIASFHHAGFTAGDHTQGTTGSAHTTPWNLLRLRSLEAVFKPWCWSLPGWMLVATVT